MKSSITLTSLIMKSIDKNLIIAKVTTIITITHVMLSHSIPITLATIFVVMQVINENRRNENSKKI